MSFFGGLAGLFGGLTGGGSSGGGGGGGVTSYDELTNKPSIPESIVNFDYPYVEKKKSDGSRYVRNISSGNSGVVAWDQRDTIT